ncbi:MAG TPA: hypothetical protein VGF76_13255 [Polyangiaceae bacterium]
MKPALLCLGLALSTLCRVSLAQSGQQPSGDAAAQPSSVTAAPQPREVAPQPSNPGNTGNAGNTDNADDVWGSHEPPRPVAAPKTKTRNTGNRTWYGTQVLTADAFSVVLVAVGLGVGSTSDDRAYLLASAGYATYLLAPSVIHLVHGRPGMVPASLGIRLGIPAAGAGLGYACCGPGLLIGFMAGVVAASAIDTAAFSWDNPQPEKPAAASFGFAPVLSADGKRGELRAFGTF